MKSYLCPQLSGLEGWRVEATTINGEKKRFIVGLTTISPCSHVEMKTQRCLGGKMADKKYENIKPLYQVWNN